ncbi:hypothetical protein SAMN05444159_7315 [Bradyrhizobium lablabi]|uniref:Uncharacterized protein n=1 Tax=Bradyrhizobium lablabi TaxID=722472 RepID=A0A1M7EXQ9_9BRAD|nr:hypothetical protein [Bradyrhizobium lablabi]SHL96565.1 hypothetical protein SAMN05444159_7315 [Bradyrhizobium lablabi]
MTHKIVKMMLTGVALAVLGAAPALADPGLGTTNARSTNLLSTNAQSTNSAGEFGRVVAVELPRR